MVKSKSKSRSKKGARKLALRECGVVKDDGDVVFSGKGDGAPGHRGRGGVRERGGLVELDGGNEEEWLPCPIPSDPAMGDKTPGVMAWYREHRPEEFQRRYGNRVCPEVADVVKRGGARGRLNGEEERGPVSDFEDEEEDKVVVKPRVIMG